jgi:hypothetical protein
MDDYTDRQCASDYTVTLTECLEACIQLATALEAQAAITATYPRVGTLLSVRNDIRETLAKLPAPEPLTEAEQVQRACTEG